MAQQLIEVPVQQGIVGDTSPYSSDAGVWTSGQNVQFVDGKTQKRKGYSQIFGRLGVSGSADVTPYWAMPWNNGGTDYWIYAAGTHATNGAINVYRTTGATSSPALITRSAGAYTISKKWNGGVLAGIAYVNSTSAVDKPQYISQGASVLADLPSANWPSTYQSAQVIRTFKQFLIAMNIEVSSTQQTNLVGWSDAISDYNALPKWDITDATQDAGEVELSSTDGKVLDGQSLKDVFIIYKEDAVWAMQHIGGDFVFKFTNIFDDVGMLTDNCVASFDGKHFVVGRDDVYVHNGVTKESVISKRMRKFLFDQIEPTQYDLTYVVPHYTSNEMWICYVPTGDDDFPTKALVWNWLDNTWAGDIDIPESPFAAFGVVNDSQATTDWSETGTWEEDATSWDDSSYNPTNRKIVFCAPSTGSGEMFQGNSTHQANGASYLSFVEKTGINIGTTEKVKYISGMIPRISGSGNVDIYVGGEYVPNAGVTWDGPVSFDIGTDYKADFKASGRYLGVRFESTDNNTWSLEGYDIILDGESAR